MGGPARGEGGGELAAELRDAIAGEVRFDAGARALYATDASNYRQVPIGVVTPRTVEDVVATVAACRRHGAPVLARGGGTSLAGQCCNVAVVLDFSRHLNRILALDPERRLARVEPGLVLDTLRDAAEEHGLTFGPDPATHNRCTLGGMIGNNSCGVHSVMAGKTDDNVEALEVLTYDGLRLTVGATGEEELAGLAAEEGRRGEIYRRLVALRDRCAPLIRARYPKIPRRVSGFNLDQLLPENGFHVARALVGSEGTCVTVLAATVAARPQPAGADARRPRLLRRLHRRRPRGRGPRAPADRPRGDRRRAGRGHEEEAPPSARAGAAARGQGLAARRVRRRGSRGGRREGGRPDRGARRRRRRAGGEALRPPRGEARLARPRVGARGDGARPRRARHLGGVGGRGGAAGGPRRLPPRLPPAPPATRLRLHPLRPLRRRLRPHADRLRPGDAAGAARLPRLRRGGGGPRPPPRRVALRRARRRPVARRAAAEDVRPRAGRGLPRVQGDLGPRRQDEPRQGRGPLPPRREPPPRHELQAGAAPHPLPLPRRRRQPRPRHPALRRGRRVPEAPRRHDVPELHGDRRGDALDARPRAPALRDAARRDARRRLARPARQGGARPLPRLQGVQDRVPGQRRHGELQGGVPLPLLRAPAAAALGLRLRPHPLVGASSPRSGRGRPMP